MEFGEIGYLASIILLILGSVNHILSLFSIHVFANLMLRRVFYGIIGLAGIYLMFNRYTYYPLLGPASLPGLFIKDVVGNRPWNMTMNDVANKGTEKSQLLKQIPKEVTSVAYWTALPPKMEKDMPVPYTNMEEAYGEYKNSGVSLVMGLTEEGAKKTYAELFPTQAPADVEKLAINYEALKAYVVTLVAASKETDVKKKQEDALKQIKEHGNFAVLHFNCPGSYKGYMGNVNVSISYRFINNKKGSIGPVVEVELPLEACKTEPQNK
jgi:uncharacterized membrane protein YuzA (DUF378 family)